MRKKIITFKGAKYVVTDGYLKLASGEVTPRNITEKYVSHKLRNLLLVKFDIQTYWDNKNGNPYAAGTMSLYFKNGDCQTIGKSYNYDNADNLKYGLVQAYAKECLCGVKFGQYDLQKAVGRDFVVSIETPLKYREICKINHDGKVSVTKYKKSITPQQ
jgi:hypothetical protein